MTLDQFATSLVDWVWATPLFFMLLGCGLVFSIVSKFVQVRILTHGYACIRGHYDRPEDVGQISHFQALCAALSATVGLGNIAGVAVAVSLGGPGAVFWMWVVGVFGMALKFMECSLAVMYRDVRNGDDSSGADTEVRGGPMWYIQKALVDPLRKRGNPLWFVFKILAVLFAVATILNSFGGGNMFQGWNIADMLHKHFDVKPVISATIVSILVAAVIVGGIKRIGTVASKLVPIMCVFYVAGAMYVILQHATEVPYYLALIVKSAFTPVAESGACAGVSVWIAFQWGLKRACFSNEAGEGSAAMAHAAAKTDQPIREGVVAGIGPFVDTIIICTMSALVLLMSGAWNRPAVGAVASVGDGVVVVECQHDLPEKFEPLYLARVRVGGTLGVQIVRNAQQNLKTLALPITDIERSDETSWAGITTITLDTSRLEGDDREKVGDIAVGQFVDLDITGADLTGFAFDTVLIGFGKWMVTLGVCLFGFSTMLSWSYYGETGAEYLLGPKAILPFKFVFVIFVFFGMVLEKFQTIYDFSDATTGMMVLCNLPAVLILSPVVIRATREYFRRLKAGEFPRRD